MHLAIDIGGTNIVLGLVSGGRLLSAESHFSFRRGAGLEETVTYLFSLIDRVVNESVKTIGAGVTLGTGLGIGVIHNNTGDDTSLIGTSLIKESRYA